MNLATVATAAGAAFALGRILSRHEVVAARREANTDALTGLVSRAGLTHQLRNRTRTGHPYTLFMLDLNGFKQVNDTYGHRAGDELLAALGARLRRELTPRVVARLGGDEFVVLADGPRTGDDDMALAARLIGLIEEPIDVTAVPEPVSLGTAVGIAPARPGEDPRITLNAADQAMYRSKAIGAPLRQTSRSRAVTDDAPRVRLRDTRPARVPSLL